MEQLEQAFRRFSKDKKLKVKATAYAWVIITVCLSVFLLHVAYEVLYKDSDNLSAQYDAAALFLATPLCAGTGPGLNSLVLRRCEDFTRTVRMGRYAPYFFEFVSHCFADATSWQVIAALSVGLCVYGYMFARGPLVLYQEQKTYHEQSEELRRRSPFKLLDNRPSDITWDQPPSISVHGDLPFQTTYVSASTPAQYPLTPYISTA